MLPRLPVMKELVDNALENGLGGHLFLCHVIGREVLVLLVGLHAIPHQDGIGTILGVTAVGRDDDVQHLVHVLPRGKAGLRDLEQPFDELTAEEFHESAVDEEGYVDVVLGIRNTDVRE